MESEKISIHDLIYKAEIETQTLRTNIRIPRVKGRDGMNGDTGIDIHSLLTLCIKKITIDNLDFSGGSMVKNPPANAGELGSIPGLKRSFGEGNGNPLTSVFLPGKYHGQRSQVGYSPWGSQRVRHDWATKQLKNLLYSTGNSAQCSVVT